MSLDVLVVDDNEDIAALVGVVLRARGHLVRLALGGRDGLAELARGPRPDLVLLDVQMPDVDGWHVLSRVRAHQGLEGLPVVLCTVKSSEEDRAHAAELGADGFLTKPFDIEALISAVEGFGAREAG